MKSTARVGRQWLSFGIYAVELLCFIPGTENNFDKYEASTITDFGVEYDYGSVMHYGAYAFSKNGEITIEPKVS